MDNTKFIVRTIKNICAIQSTLKSLVTTVEELHVSMWHYLPYIKVEYFTEDSNTAYRSEVSDAHSNYRKWILGEAEEVLREYVRGANMLLKALPQLHHAEIWLNVAPENIDKELRDIEEPDVYVTREGAKSIIKY